MLLALAGILGLAAGRLLKAVVARVPAHVPLGRRPAVEAATGGAFAAVTWWALRARPGARTGADAPDAALADPAFWPTLVAYLFLAAVSIALALVDLDVHRLPNVLVLPTYLVGGALLLLACLFGAPWASLLAAAAGMAVAYAFYLAVRLAAPRGMGGGDVKLAGALGLFLGWAGAATFAVGMLAGFVLGGLFGVVLMVARRAGRKTAIPFGPWMLLGTWVGLVAGEPLGRWYLGS